MFDHNSADSPSHHDTDPFDIARIQLTSALLVLAPIRRLEARPRHEDAARLITRRRVRVYVRGLRLKVIFVRDGRLLPSILRVAREQLVLEDQRVSFPC